MGIVDSIDIFDAPSLDSVIDHVTAALGRGPTVTDHHSTEWWGEPYVSAYQARWARFAGEPVHYVSVWHPDVDAQHAATRRLFDALVRTTPWSIEADVNDDAAMIDRRFDT